LFHFAKCWIRYAERGYGVPTLNVSNLAQIVAFMEAAQETDRPKTPASDDDNVAVTRRVRPSGAMA